MGLDPEYESGSNIFIFIEDRNARFCLLSECGVCISAFDVTINKMYSNGPFIIAKHEIFQSKRTRAVSLVGRGEGNRKRSSLIENI